MRLGHDVDRANDGRPATSSATWVAMASHSRTASISPFTMPRASQPRLSDIQSSPSKPGLSRSNAALIVAEPLAADRRGQRRRELVDGVVAAPSRRSPRRPAGPG